MNFDLIVVGGGPAGMAVAFSAEEKGLKVLLVEREYALGGILNQCIHNGFGLHYLGKELTGPEYANVWIKKLAKTNVKIMLSSVVTKVEHLGEQNVVVHIKNEQGIVKIKTKAVAFSTGCREKPGPAINLCGTRPAGVFSAGEAQKLVNVHGKLVGKRVAILGSGDVGLIMARRMTCVGAKVVGVYEIMPTCGGLARNVAQCLNDFNIPLHLSTSIVRVVGENRVTGVVVAPVNPDFSFDLSKQKLVKCDTLLLSVGLLPEVDILNDFNLERSPVTNSFVVNQFYQTKIPEFFLCGNALHVNDLVDNVTVESLKVGESVANFVKNGKTKKRQIEIKLDKNIRYTSFKYVFKNTGLAEISFRVSGEFRNAKIVATSGGEVVFSAFKTVVRAGQIEKIVLDTSKLKTDLNLGLEVAQ